jgi:ribosomal protein S18 acetylase RimI-like enzyme
MPFTSRLAHEEDLSFIIRLSAQVFSRYGNYDEIVSGWFEEPGVITKIIADEDTPQGFAMLVMEREKVFGARRAHLLAIGIVPEHQRKGIGTTLLGSMENLAQQYGGKEIVLMTAVDNQTALAFFQKAGFEVIGTQDQYYPKGQPALAMRKRLE